jgi:hypothetical protein
MAAAIRNRFDFISFSSVLLLARLAKDGQLMCGQFTKTCGGRAAVCARSNSWQFTGSEGRRGVESKDCSRRTAANPEIDK